MKLETLIKSNNPDKQIIVDSAVKARINLLNTYTDLKNNNPELLKQTSEQSPRLRINQLITVSNIYGHAAKDYFEFGNNIKLTKPSRLSLTDSRFEYGKRNTRSESGNYEDKLGLWFIHAGSTIEVDEDAFFSKIITNPGSKNAINQFIALSPLEIYGQFVSHLRKASNNITLK